jgi:hypothetical protein
MRKAILLAALLTTAPLVAQERPALSGQWTLNRGLSKNVESQITEVAGPDDVKGYTGFGPEGHPGLGILPVTGAMKDVDRLYLRRLIMAASASLERIEVDLAPAEFKHVDSKDNVRIFYLTRDHVRIGRNEEKVACHSEWQEDKLVITQKGDSGVKLLEVFSMIPSRDQLVHSVRLEDPKLKKPLELTFVYDRTPK